jgi:hypothetical protein
MLPPESTSTTPALQLRQLAGDQSGEHGGAGTFDHPLLQLDQAQDRDRDRGLVNRDHLVDQITRDREQMRPDPRRRKTVGQCVLQRDPGRFAGRQCRRIAGGMLGLYADDLDLRTQRFHSPCDARDQAAAADRRNDRIDVGHLLEYLEPDRSLPGDERCVVVASRSCEL